MSVYFACQRLKESPQVKSAGQLAKWYTHCCEPRSIVTVVKKSWQKSQRKYTLKLKLIDNFKNTLFELRRAHVGEIRIF